MARRLKIAAGVVLVVAVYLVVRGLELPPFDVSDLPAGCNGVDICDPAGASPLSNWRAVVAFAGLLAAAVLWVAAKVVDAQDEGVG